MMENDITGSAIYSKCTSQDTQSYPDYFYYKWTLCRRNFYLQRRDSYICQAARHAQVINDNRGDLQLL